MPKAQKQPCKTRTQIKAEGMQRAIEWQALIGTNGIESKADLARYKGFRIIAPETGRDVTRFHVNGAKYTLEIAKIVGAHRAYLKSGSPSCDREGVTGEVLKRNGIKVIRVP